MKSYSRFISLIGGMIALFGFVLIWDSGFNDSGIEVANSSFNIITIMFLASYVIILTCLMFTQRTAWDRRMSRGLVFFSGGFGIFGFFILFFGDAFNVEIDNSEFDMLSYGGFVTVIGFILSIYGASKYPRTIQKSEPTDKPNEDLDTEPT